MIKEIIQKICILLLWGGCATHSIQRDPGTPQISLLWSRKMAGAISCLSVSKGSNAILVATNPDKDIEGSSEVPLLSRYSSNGALEWQIEMKSPVKDQNIDETGSIAVISNFENEIRALNPKGKVIWSHEGMCRPLILNSSQKILCYHDDDAEPHVAFDILDYAGQKIFSFPIQKDILALKISSDEKNIAIALTEGEVLLIDSHYHKVWEKRVDGEVIDVAVTAGSQPQVSVLYQRESAGRTPHSQEVAFFNSSGEALGKVLPSTRAVQLETSPTGDSVFYYGNGALGQAIGALSISQLQEVWKWKEAKSTDYSYSISVAPQFVLLGYEEFSKTSRRSHLKAFSYDGVLKWDLPLEMDEGAYLYGSELAGSQMVLGASSFLAIGTDDARLSVYKIGQNL